MKELTFEEVNAKVEELDFNQLEKTMEIGMRADRGTILETICNIWKKIDGVVRFIAKYTIIPKWRKALNLLIKTMDGICGIA